MSAFRGRPADDLPAPSIREPRRVAERLTDQFERDLARSKRIEVAEWARQGRIERTLELVNLAGSEL